MPLPLFRETPAGPLLASLLLALSCASEASPPPPDPLARRIEAHVQELASDAYGGRAPGTDGGDAAAEYVESRLRAAGLEPAGTQGFRQPVPLVGVRTTRGTRLIWTGSPGEPRGGSGRADDDPGGGAGRVETEFFIAGWNRGIERSRTVAEAVFVGYGVVDEEQGRDDLAGAELEGRWAVALDGAPPGQPRSLSPVAGQPVTKLYEARRRGAVGLVLLSHLSDWPEPYDLAREERILPGWGRGERGQPIPWIAVRGPLVDSLSSGRNLWEAAVARGFRAFPLAGRLDLELVQEVRRFEHPNLLARLPGADSSAAAAHVCLSAHYDGLGRSRERIYRGVIDNAVGVAELLEAAALAREQGGARRSLLFFFPTAEEAGLLGSQFFVEHPTVPLDSILGCLNKDGAPEAWGKATDVIAIAAAASPPFEAALQGEVGRLGLAWSRNPFPAEGFFFRSDHYSFLRAGVPGALLFAGLAFEERPQAWGVEQAMVYLKDHYHRSSDDVPLVLDWGGPARYARIWLRLARALADGPELPRTEIRLEGAD